MDPAINFFFSKHAITRNNFVILIETEAINRVTPLATTGRNQVLLILNNCKTSP